MQLWNGLVSESVDEDNTADQAAAVIELKRWAVSLKGRGA